LVNKADPEGRDRLKPGVRGKILAGKSTLNRLELTPVGTDADSRYKKVVARPVRRNSTPPVFSFGKDAAP
jgi:hypothetical protein